MSHDGYILSRASICYSRLEMIKWEIGSLGDKVGSMCSIVDCEEASHFSSGKH
jgi:hypothetical protein